MANYNWDNIDEVYFPLDKKVRNGDLLEIEIITFEQIDEFNLELIKSFIRTWSLPLNEKYVKVFKILESIDGPNLIKAKIQLKHQITEEVDEIREFCQDVLHILNSDHIHVSKFSVKDANN